LIRTSILHFLLFGSAKTTPKGCESTKTKVRNTEIEAKARHGTPGMKCSLPSIYLDFRVPYLDFAVCFSVLGCQSEQRWMV
jgi:hypothetical protein